MRVQWPWRRSSSTPPTPRRKLAAEPPPSLAPPAVILVRLEDGPRGEEIIAALGDSYEVLDVGWNRQRFKVLVADTVFEDEAVVRVASRLDAIDPEWPRHLSWPKFDVDSDPGQVP